jgi:hypothetical protein
MTREIANKTAPGTAGEAGSGASCGQPAPGCPARQMAAEGGVAPAVVEAPCWVVGEMSDRPAALARQPSWTGSNPPPGAWCRACHGTRWWTERHEPKGWRCMTCHPPVHLPAEAVRREGEGEAVSIPRAQEAGGINLDE